MSAFSKARELVDAAHGTDPSGAEQHYADSVEAWAVRFLSSEFASAPSRYSSLLAAPSSEELVRLGARCQHLERFKTPRDSFPEGKAGYLKWRRSLYVIQADRARELLLQAGVETEQADLVRKWVSKADVQPGKGDEGDAGTQLLEDAAVMVFLQEQLASFAAQHGEYTRAKFVDILKKTWRKLSAAGQEAVQSLELPEGLAGIVAEATEAPSASQAADELVQPSEDVKLGSDASAGPSSNPPSQPKRTSSAAPHIADEAESSSFSSKLTPEEVKKRELDKGGRTFGARILEEGDDMWKHNAWDHATPPPEHVAMVEGLLSKQRETRVSAEDAETYHADAAGYWNTFYASHDHKFFKDRHWLHLEFPELVATTKEDAPPATVLEVGCGAGNTVYPLLEMNKNPNLRLFACDYSAEAVRVVKANPLYDSPPIGYINSSVWDLCSTNPLPDTSPSSTSLADTTPNLPEGITPHSVDIVVLIFVLSALHPREWDAAVRNVHAALKPGGIVLLRDYGRHDLPQLRFRKGRLLEENFYVRGDGTRVYFFTPDELRTMFKATAPPEAREAEATSTSSSDESHLFETLQLAVDRRLLLNRKEKKSMWRVWNQVKLRAL